jgi:hypothetical protein
MSTRLSIINTSARTGILKPSLRTISIASVPLLIAENSNLPYGQFQVLTYALDKQNELPEYYLQIPW